MEIESDPKKRSGKTILIVDDNAAIRKTVADAFLSDGFKICVEADNGKKGIEVAKQCQPDVIILDLSMPVLNGLETAPELRKLFPKTPLILFTMYYHSTLETIASEAGINLVLGKTVPLSTLVEKAHDLMGG